jgi:hypothetical protein
MTCGPASPGSRLSGTEGTLPSRAVGMARVLRWFRPWFCFPAEGKIDFSRHYCPSSPAPYARGDRQGDAVPDATPPLYEMLHRRRGRAAPHPAWAWEENGRAFPNLTQLASSPPSSFPTPQNPSRRHQVEELIRRGSALLKEELI